MKTLAVKWITDEFFFIFRKTALFSMDQSCSILHASRTLQETFFSKTVWRGTNSACARMGLCSVCWWNSPAWAARHQTTHVERPINSVVTALCSLSTQKWNYPLTNVCNLDIFSFFSFLYCLQLLITLQ